MSAVAGVIAWLFVLYVGIFLPIAAWRSSGKAKRLPELPPRTKLYASVAEEAAYRGVLFQLGLVASGSFWVAGLASAVVFGLTHVTQGRRPAVVAGVIGFGNQVIVLLTGSLWVVIAAHFTYDVLAGLAVGRVGRSANARAEAATAS